VFFKQIDTVRLQIGQQTQHIGVRAGVVTEVNRIDRAHRSRPFIRFDVRHDGLFVRHGHIHADEAALVAQRS
jgi:hypothetical protein